MTASRRSTRPLNEEERALLDYLLTLDQPGVEQLREPVNRWRRGLSVWRRRTGLTSPYGLLAMDTSNAFRLCGPTPSWAVFRASMNSAPSVLDSAHQSKRALRSSGSCPCERDRI